MTITQPYTLSPVEAVPLANARRALEDAISQHLEIRAALITQPDEVSPYQVLSWEEARVASFAKIVEALAEVRRTEDAALLLADRIAASQASAAA